MKKIKGGKTWTLPRRVQFLDVTFVTALESYLDVLITSARYGRKLSAFTYPAFQDKEMINAIETDKSLPKTTQKRLIRERKQSLGTCLHLAAKHGKAQQIARVLSKNFRRQTNQEKVFKSYRAVLRREGRPPTFREWVEEDSAGTLSNLRVYERDEKERAERIRDYKRNRDHVLREMQKRFKLPITPAS
jgi:hypothetical protein